MKRLILILTAWLVPALVGAQGIPIQRPFPQSLTTTSTPIFNGLGPLTGPVTLDTTSNNTFRRQMSAPTLTSATKDDGSGSLAAGVYTITVVGVDLAGGTSLYPTATTATTAGGSSHIDVVYVAPVGAVSVRVYVSAADGATPDRYFTSTSATTYALTTLVGATVAALPTSNTAYRFSIGGETQNWWSLPMKYESAALGTTETMGLALQNLWPASAATTVQISPSFDLYGSALNSTSGLSESHRWFQYVLPVTVAGTTTSTLRFGHSLNGAAATYPFAFGSNNKIIFGASPTTIEFAAIPGSTQVTFTSGVIKIAHTNDGARLALGDDVFIGRAGAQQLNLQDLTGSATKGVGLDFATDALLKVRTRAQTGDASISALNATLSGPQVTAGAHATVVQTGAVNRLTYKATVTATTCSAAFIAAALTADCTIATLPAKTKLVGVYADVTAAFTCSGTCTGTKTIGAGISAGGVEILAAGADIAATGQIGDADAELGTAMTRAAAIQGGYMPSWTATSPVIVRVTSGTGNWGDGAATYVNAGSISFYLVTEVMP